MKKHIYFLLILLAFSCTKDKVEIPDYRNKYIGQWDFKVYQQEKVPYQGIIYNNFDYSGQIKLGLKPNEILLIYSDSNSVSLIVEDNYVFAELPDGTYPSDADFINENKIKISINSGGQGGWYFLDITGIRK